MAPSHFHAHETARFDELDGLLLATFSRRAIGFVVDFLVVILLWAPLELLWARYFSHEWDGHTHYEIKFSFHEWRSFLVALLYFVLINYLTNGRSLGKWITRTRIVSLVEGRIGLWQCIERVLGYGVAAGELIGFLQYFWSTNRMCVQDRMAETIVIDTRKSATRLPHSKSPDQK